VDQRLGDYFFQSGGVNEVLFQGFENSRFFNVHLELGDLDAKYSNIYHFQVVSDKNRHRRRAGKMQLFQPALPTPGKPAAHLKLIHLHQRIVHEPLPHQLIQSVFVFHYMDNS
jgi:hypothetical protein